MHVEPRSIGNSARLPRFPQLLNVAERSLPPPEIAFVIAFKLEYDTRGLDYVDELQRSVDDS